MKDTSDTEVIRQFEAWLNMHIDYLQKRETGEPGDEIHIRALTASLILRRFLEFKSGRKVID